MSHQHVVLESAGLPCPVITVRASVRFLPGVYHVVVAKLSSVIEGRAANWAHVLRTRHKIQFFERNHPTATESGREAY